MSNQSINSIEIYKQKDGSAALNVRFEEETVWLTQKEMSALFHKNVRTVNEHIQSIYKEKELIKRSTVRNFRIVQKEGNRTVEREVEQYNLDVIISVGYRVKSKEATNFRIWATNILKQHLITGVTINQHQLQHAKQKELQQAIGIIKNAMQKHELSTDETQGLLQVITEYAEAWLLLLQYDEQAVEPPKTKTGKYVLTYNEAQSAIDVLKETLMQKGEASELFGKLRTGSLKGIIGNVYQTFDGNELYGSVQQKAAHLLYFIIKDHPFADGNKRIATLLFLIYLKRNKVLFNKNLETKFNSNGIVAIALLTAESDPKQKEVIINLIMQCIG